MTTIAVPMIIFYRWHGVENTVGASSAEYTLGNALKLLSRILLQLIPIFLQSSASRVGQIPA